MPINSKKLRGKKYQIEEKARHLKAITKYLQMANYEKQIKGEWNQSKNETTPSSSQTGHMATNLSMIRSIGHNLHYSDHQTKVLICNLVKNKLYKKMKFVNNNQLYYQPTKKGTICKKITEECYLSYGSEEHKEQWWQTVTVEFKKHTHIYVVKQ